ncbi:MAG: universal stress protein [Pseudomonadales bacterium]
MKKILCTTDETEVSRKAEAFAAQMAKGVGAELHYVHVSKVTSDDLKTPGHLDVVIIEEVDARNHLTLQKATESAKANGISNATFLTLNGRDVAKAVIEYAEKNGCDHIVTGSNGRVGIPRLVMGSVSGDIIHKAHCPVTVIR